MILGIDYAAVDTNNTPDLIAAKKAGLAFAIVRGCYNVYADSACRRDWQPLLGAGIVRGAYLFPVINKASAGPAVQVAAFAKAMVTAGGIVPGVDLPPTLDVEFPGSGVSQTGMPLADVIAWLTTAVDALKQTYGTPPMIYTSKRVVYEDLQDKLPTMFADCPLWVKSAYRLKARQPVDQVMPVEPPCPPPWGAGNWWVQQFQGDAVHFPGYSSTVDVNRFNPLSAATPHDPRIPWLQRRLAILGAPFVGPLAVTGTWNPETEHSVRAFQHLHGLVADSVIGPRTACRLLWP